MNCPRLMRFRCAARVLLGLAMLLPGLPSWADPSSSSVLRLAVERDYAPFVFVDEAGQAQGLSIDFLALVLQRSGLQVQPQEPRPLADLLDDLRGRRADLITSLRSTPERAQFLVFSRPYIDVPAILVVGPAVSAAQARKGLQDLSGRPVAIGKGYGVEAPMRSRFPRVDWQAVADDASALRGVAEGRFAAAVADAASVAYLIRREGFMNLRPAGRVGFDYPLSFALEKSLAPLMPRLDQAILEIPADQRQTVIDRWMGDLDLQTYDRQPRWLLWSGVVLLTAGAALLLLKHLRQTAPRSDGHALESPDT